MDERNERCKKPWRTSSIPHNHSIRQGAHSRYQYLELSSSATSIAPHADNAAAFRQKTVLAKTERATELGAKHAGATNRLAAHRAPASGAFASRNIHSGGPRCVSAPNISPSMR